MADSEVMVSEDDKGNLVFGGLISKRHIDDLKLNEHADKAVNVEDPILMMIALVRVLGGVVDALAKTELDIMRKGSH